MKHFETLRTECPNCKEIITVNAANIDFDVDQISDRKMGNETEYSAESNIICAICGKHYKTIQVFEYQDGRIEHISLS